MFSGIPKPAHNLGQPYPLYNGADFIRDYNARPRPPKNPDDTEHHIRLSVELKSIRLGILKFHTIYMHFFVYFLFFFDDTERYNTNMPCIVSKIFSSSICNFTSNCNISNNIIESFFLIWYY